VNEVQRRVIYERPNVVVLPPAPNTLDPRQDPRLRQYLAAAQSEDASRSRMIAASRSRLTLPVPPDETVRRAIPVPNTDSSLEQASSEEPKVTVRPKPETPVRAEVVATPAAQQQGEPEYGTPVFGRRGFVRPPGTAAAKEKDQVIIDVRDFSPGEKVRDPRTGMVFLVPPTA